MGGKYCVVICFSLRSKSTESKHIWDKNLREDKSLKNVLLFFWKIVEIIYVKPVHLFFHRYIFIGIIPPCGPDNTRFAVPLVFVQNLTGFFSQNLVKSFHSKRFSVSNGIYYIEFWVLAVEEYGFTPSFMGFSLWWPRFFPSTFPPSWLRWFHAHSHLRNLKKKKGGKELEKGGERKAKKKIIGFSLKKGTWTPNDDDWFLVERTGIAGVMWYFGRLWINIKKSTPEIGWPTWKTITGVATYRGEIFGEVRLCRRTIF